MDEPTSVLTPQEVERLFDTLRKLASEGVSILYISHKLEEIRQLCDRATILRGGRVVALCDPRAETAKSMAQMMIGAELKTVTRRSAPEARGGRRGAVRTEVDGRSPASEALPGHDLQHVSFAGPAGEVIGIPGGADHAPHRA